MEFKFPVWINSIKPVSFRPNKPLPSFQSYRGSTRLPPSPLSLFFAPFLKFLKLSRKYLLPMFWKEKERSKKVDARDKNDKRGRGRVSITKKNNHEDFSDGCIESNLHYYHHCHHNQWKNTPLSFLASPEFTELGELFGRVGFGGKSTSLSAFLSARIHHRIRELSLFFTLEGLDKPVVAGPSKSPLPTSREL